MDGLKDLLGEELSKQVESKLGDKKIIINDGTYIPKAKFDEKLSEVKDLQEQIKTRDKQISELGEKSKGNEEMAKTIADLKEANKKATTEYEDKLKQQAFNHILDSEITKNKDEKVSVKAFKAMLDLDKIKVDGDKLIGLDDQISALKKSDTYLFQPTTPGASGGQGGNPANVGASIQTLEQQLEAAQKAGQTAVSIAIQNKLFEQRSKTI